MDILKRLSEFVSKYRYAFLVGLLGVVLMLLPTGTKEEEAAQEPQTTETVSLSKQLEEILSAIEGVGKVQVLLTEREGERTVYQYDEGSGTDTVIITDGNRAEQGLVQQVIPPVYLGAVVVCQGADSASVRLSVIEAVADVTGLATDKISVLKMK